MDLHHRRAVDRRRGGRCVLVHRGLAGQSQIHHAGRKRVHPRPAQGRQRRYTERGIQLVKRMAGSQGSQGVALQCGVPHSFVAIVSE